MGKGYLFIIFFCLVLSESLLGKNLQSPEIFAYKRDSLLTVIKTTKDRKENISIYCQLAHYSDKVEAYIYATEAVELARKEKDKQLLGKALQYLGTANMAINNINDAVENYVESSKLLIETGIDKKAPSYLRVAMIYYRIENYENAISYYKRSEVEYQKDENFKSLMGVYSYLSMCYLNQNNLDSALFYIDKSLQFKDKTLTIIRSARNTALRGTILMKQGKWDEGKYEIEKAINAAKLLGKDKTGNQSMITNFKMELAKYYIHQNNFEKVVSLLEPLLKNPNIYNLPKHRKQLNEILYETHKELGNYEISLYNYTNYIELRDSLKNTERTKKQDRERYNFEIEYRKNQIEQLNKTNQLKTNLLTFEGISLIILISTFLYILRAHQKLKKTSKILNDQNIILEKKEEEKSLLLRELNHRVKNNLQMVTGLLSLQANQLGDHPAADALKSGMLRVEALTLLHQKLYRTESDTKIDIKDFIEDLINGLIKNIDHKIDLELKLDSYVMNMDKAIPLGLILNELVTNSIKYGIQQGSTSKLVFTISQTSENLKIKIADNGSGLPDGFNWKKTQTFGLKLVNSMTKQLNGTIKNDSTNGCVWNLDFKRNRLEKIV